MNPLDVIRKKRGGTALSEEEISFFVKGFAAGNIPDYQMSALLMAIVLKGMNPKEVFHLTFSMMNSGRILEFENIKKYKVDKHSTGGVGDKISIVLAPLVASCGLAVPMISGRGLGHTGGTLDKLESIPGFKTLIPASEFSENLIKSGVSIICQSNDLVPADKLMYALRDATATVESVPLITASILSKKLAEGIDGLVMDVKVGRGAFMKTLADARTLAISIKNVMRIFKKKVVFLLTNMDEPIGLSIGNSLEIKECIEVLKGKGPKDVIDLTLELGAHMLLLGGKDKSLSLARKRLLQKLNDGSALCKFKELVVNQSGDPDIIENPSLLGESKYAREIKSIKGGFLSAIHSEKLGLCLVNLGAGRLQVTDRINYSAGAVLKRKVGDKVEKGQTLAIVHFDDEKKYREQENELVSCFEINNRKPRKKPLILQVIK